MIDSGADGTTFIKPGLKDEIEDWGNRGDLLQKYRTLATLMKERTGRPTLDDAPKKA
ncbi:MAG TPA: hypothetical protein VHC20_06665 [Candidatus Paceibacterota bacterium]|nr:hypothetical protein [Candidatus Paceibacterota bacterium]